jgi:hypothetical protein
MPINKGSANNHSMIERRVFCIHSIFLLTASACPRIGKLLKAIVVVLRG